MSANAEIKTGAPVAGPAAAVDASKPVTLVLWLMCLAHILHDTLQALLSSIYPILKDAYALDFTQIGMIALAFQITASLLQPLIGWYTDKRPQPWSLPVGMLATVAGLYLLATASSYPGLLIAAALVGTGSSVFHPEGSRVVRMAAGNKPSTAQATFQVGGNIGQASGPLSAAFVIVPLGQKGILWFAGVAFATVLLLLWIGRWYAQNVAAATKRARKVAGEMASTLTSRTVTLAISLLLLLMFSKSVYTSCLNTFYVFFLMEKFGVSLRDAQFCFFLYMASVAAGVYFGGPIGDRLGLKTIIWISVLGPLPFFVLLPYVDLVWTVILIVIIGFIMSSSLSQMVVYAMELAPARTGMLAGLFLGLAFGFSGIAAAALGRLADATSVETIFRICSFAPAVGVLAFFLPDVSGSRRA